ncbi:aminoacyl tRNA synthase complex-interacting multifunctional protein 1 [Solea senegalensis]|uniref:Aminoacyl tRNA synthase complex-interacting multifunctional protein 1 n=1 Tax=Solea senegalensis TaxID=28829 RepID=A0AAV6Q7K9_SOLSE|nr:aminoacyl tRNA synthase complex-interacting multifunctional protein 1-like isoform X1 [Solea senegalensis]KAG7485352.1 aminoacyl tRNA synthase complex-interacting multifunctional protein 1 [Solea senegalensis]
MRSFVRSLINMSSHNPLLKLEQRAAEADQIIEYLKQQVQLLKEKTIAQASVREEKKLMVENAKLKNDIEELKKQLLEKEKRRGVLEVAMPSGEPTVECSSKPTPPESSAPAPTASPAAATQTLKEEGKKKKPEKKGGEKAEKKAAAPTQEDAKVDVSRLDLRIGRIITADKHPDADSLYVEQVDVGEALPRTVVSGLVKHIPLDQMQNRMAVLLCNLKPAKMRGVVSQAMVMCASSPDKVEILDPPGGAVPGERVTFQGFPGEPDKELNPKKKVWEQVQPDLHTDGQCVATYKGAAFEVAGKGVCKAQTMSNSGIK